VRRVPFSCFVHPDSFSTVSRATGPVFMFCAPGLVSGSTEGVTSRIHVWRSRHVFDSTEGVRFRFQVFHPQSCFWWYRGHNPFHVLRARTHFRLYRGRQLWFSCYARPDSFSAVPRASGLVLMFCAPGLIFGGAECVGSRFHVLRPESFSVVPRASHPVFMFSAVPRSSGLVFMFCAPGHVFGGLEGVGPRKVPFSCFALPDLFSSVPRESGPIFIIYAPGHIFGGTEGVSSRFHILRSRTRFRRRRVRRVPFSCFACPNSLSATPSASGPIFMFCAPELAFDGTNFLINE
jgi:hypothetical protein